MTQEPDTTIWIASINTAWNTEWCLRSPQVRDAEDPYRVVGDCRSTDRTLPMVVRMARLVWSTTSSSHPEAGPMPGGSTTG